MNTTTTNGLTITRRPQHADDSDPVHADFHILINGNLIGGTYRTTDGTYTSWGRWGSCGHATREAAEQVQINAAITARLDILHIQIHPDRPYRVTVSAGEDETLPGTMVQQYLDSATRCGATVTGTSEAFTIYHTTEEHLPRACEHQDQAVTYRPQLPSEPNVVPASRQNIPTDRAPLPTAHPADPDLRQHVSEHMRTHHEKGLDAGWKITRNDEDGTIGVIFLAGVFGSHENTRALNLYTWERTLREDGFGATVRHDLDFAEPGTPTRGPWWVHITGRTIQVAPTG